jgi:hypothetical protein
VLTHERFTRAHGSDQFPRRVAAQLQLDSCADSVAVAVATFQLDRKMRLTITHLIAQQANSRSGSASHPQVLVAVMVPIHEAQAAGIVWEIQGRHARHVRKWKRTDV